MSRGSYARIVLVATLLVSPIMSRADVPSVPPAAVRFAQEWLTSKHFLDAELVGARIGTGYPVISIGPKRAIEFMLSTSDVDPTSYADSSREYHFPILKGDTCFSSLAVFSMGDDGLMPMGQLQHQPMPVDQIVVALNQAVAKDAGICVFKSPWPTRCSAIIVRKPGGEFVAFELDQDPLFEPDLKKTLSSEEPVVVWGDRLKKHLRGFFQVDERRPAPNHDVPTAATEKASAELGHTIIDEQKVRFEVNGKATLADPLVQYWLFPVEQLLYAESDEMDPTPFAVRIGYSFPVVVEGKMIASISLTRMPDSCGSSNGASPWTWSTSFGVPTPGSPTRELQPGYLQELGDVATIDFQGVDRWYHVLGPDSTWMCDYYPPGSRHRAIPLSELAPLLKKRIEAKYEK